MSGDLHYFYDMMGKLSAYVWVVSSGRALWKFCSGTKYEVP